MEFHQIYNFDPLGTRMNCLDFEVKAQGQGKTMYGQIRTL